MEIKAEERDRGKRLDFFLHEKLPQFSRSQLQHWIRADRVLVNGQPAKSSFGMRGGEIVAVEPSARAPLHATAEDIALTVLYEDDWLLAIDKPAGMVVHAGAGVASGTLVNALLHRFASLSTIGGDDRPGIVHRLDRFTSGVLLVAKTDASHRALSELFQSRRMTKIYLAVVHRPMPAETGRITTPIARDPVHRTRMTARFARGRSALTEWTVREHLRGLDFLEVKIGTGRTHQIRVHLSSIGHPVVGDKLYGAPEQIANMPPLGRYFLHAHRIAFVHPFTGAEMTVESPLAPELEGWLDRWRDLEQEH